MAGTFIEVGACDFDNLDALLLDGWTGYFIEPVPIYYNSLIKKVQDNSRGKNVKAYFDNCAISNFDGSGSIRYVEPDPIIPWVKGIGHVVGRDNNAITQNKELNGVIITTVDNVKFYKLDSFLNKYNINNIDIMKIDVEGHELDVLRSYSWRVKPIHLKVEYTFVGLQPLLDILIPQGYNCEYDDEDVFATFRN